jgi:hypothetical protein
VCSWVLTSDSGSVGRTTMLLHLWVDGGPMLVRSDWG